MNILSNFVSHKTLKFNYKQPRWMHPNIIFCSQQTCVTKPFNKNPSDHGTIKRTGITCKKIPCYMRDSAFRWLAS